MIVTPEYIEAELASMRDQAAMHLAMYHKADGAIQALQAILSDMQASPEIKRETTNGRTDTID
jgi:hypothetical protein